jgi:hypothetical protein
MFKVKYLYLISFLLFLMLLVLPNCNKNKEENQKVLPTEAKKNPSYQKAMIYEFKFGTMDSIGLLSSESKYDSLGNEVESIHYLEDGTIFVKYVSRYDSLNRITEKLEYNKSGNIHEKVNIFYDLNGNLSEEIYKTGEDLDYMDKIGAENKTIKYYYTQVKLFRKVEIKGKRSKIIEEIEYDSLGNKIKDYSEEDGKRRLSSEYVYDKGNKLIESILYLYNGDIGKWIWKYNKNGDEVEMREFKRNNKLNFYKYLIYNEDNLLVEQKAFNSIDEPKFVVKYFYEYH